MQSEPMAGARIIEAVHGGKLTNLSGEATINYRIVCSDVSPNEAVGRVPSKLFVNEESDLIRLVDSEKNWNAHVRERDWSWSRLWFQKSDVERIV